MPYADKQKILNYQKKYRKHNKARCKEWCDGWRENNKERIKENSRRYYRENREKILIYGKDWRAKNKEYIKEYNKRWNEGHKEDMRDYRNKYEQHRCKTDTEYNLTKLLRKRVKDVLVGNTKTDTTKNLIGCNIRTLRIWLESQFTEGMSWGNHGKWEIDHVYPLSLFNLEQPYEQRIAFNWFNLQPLWKDENRRKWNKLFI